MSRSLKKGPYVDPRVLKKVQNGKAGKDQIKTWSPSLKVSKLISKSETNYGFTRTKIY